METLALEWANLILRWLHVIAGIAWIGTSFHFMKLDYLFVPLTEKKSQAQEIGHAWLIHSGGFYEMIKYKQPPGAKLGHLNWFQWEAYSTWLSGMGLLTVIYYIGAKYTLIDEQVADITQWQAIGIGMGFLGAGWICYDLLCKSTLANNTMMFAVLSIIALSMGTFVLTKIFSPQGAFIHVGAMIGTIMAGNVFLVIMPAQKALVAAIFDGQQPDRRLATNAKIRSKHNHYATLPLLFIMISNHYPMVYMHNYNWLVLIAMMSFMGGAHYFFNLQRNSVLKPSKE